MLWFIVMLKPLKRGRSADRFCGPALEPHGVYFRGKASRTLFNGLVMRNRKVGSFKTICRTAQEGGFVVVDCAKTLKSKARDQSL